MSEDGIIAQQRGAADARERAALTGDEGATPSQTMDQEATLKLMALQLAHDPDVPAETVTARAELYFAFLKEKIS